MKHLHRWNCVHIFQAPLVLRFKAYKVPYGTELGLDEDPHKSSDCVVVDLTVSKNNVINIVAVFADFKNIVFVFCPQLFSLLWGAVTQQHCHTNSILHRYQENSDEILKIVVIKSTDAHQKSFSKLRPESDILLKPLLFLSNLGKAEVGMICELNSDSIEAAKLLAFDDAINVLWKTSRLHDDQVFV